MPLDSRAAVYTGTFDPVHLGHLDVIRRGARLYDRGDFETAVSLIAAGTIPVKALISAVVPLEEVGSAFQALDSGSGVMKVLVACESGAA